MYQPLQFLILTTAAWLNHRQEDVIEYLREENKVLRELLGSKPVRFSATQRRRLAVRGRRLGRKMLVEIAVIASPDTILRW